MPELPEVQTIVNELNPLIQNQRIERAKIHRQGIIKTGTGSFCQVVRGQQITEVSRIGKYILIGLDGGCWIVTHLRMTGKFIIQSSIQEPGKYDRVSFELRNGKQLLFNDVRCFGHIELVSDLSKHKGNTKQGWDPWDKSLTASALHRQFKNKKNAIKNALLEQTIISGLGNIYVCEILHREKISPKLQTNKLSIKRMDRLIKSMRFILDQALIHNGTSISDYKRVDEKSGEFQNFLKVYGKAGQPCQFCGESIARIKQNQRSTFLCLKCQKN